MSNFVIIALSMTLFACASNPAVRPDMYSQGENLLRSGLHAYKNDDFQSALQKFNRALLFYQSIDDTKGAHLTRINLVETLLAVSDYAAAEEQLTILKQNAVNDSLDERPQYRVVLLQVKLLYQQQQYSEALTVIEPLLLQAGTQEISDYNRLDLLGIAARLETLISKGTNSRWLNKFRAALAQEREPRQPDFQIILKRIDAIIAAHKQQYPEALQLLYVALDYYKAQADRRAIASCLEEIADIELAQHHKPRALAYLNRALAIRAWLKDQYFIDKIQQKIVQINQQT